MYNRKKKKKKNSAKFMKNNLVFLSLKFTFLSPEKVSKLDRKLRKKSFLDKTFHCYSFFHSVL